jgi:hypothetical protein
MITYIQPGLENPQGNDVNSNDGLYLHHMAAINVGKARNDPTCKVFSLPLLKNGTSSMASERFFSSGNERAIFDFSSSRIKAGYYVSPKDRFLFLIDLMTTQRKTDQKVYLTMTYEYVSGTAEGYRQIKPVWLDLGRCLISDQTPKNNRAFSLESHEWTPNFNGDVLLMQSHLHDGGTSRSH